MTTRTDILRVRIETDDDGKLHASLLRTADDADKVTRSTGKTKKATDELADTLDKSGKSWTSNSRAVTSFSDLLDDLASGQLGRAKREVAALANETGLLARLFTSGFATALAGIGSLAAEVGLFVYAGYQAHAVAARLNEELIQTGNVAGLTHSSFNAMAESIAGARGEMGRANDVLLKLATNGKIGAGSMEAIGRAALTISDATGKSVSDAADEAMKYFDGTVAGLRRADEQWHFMNASVQANVQALLDAGHAQDAMRIAATAFYAAVEPRVQAHKAEIGGIAGLWDQAKSAAGGYWEEVKTGMSVLMGTADLQTQIYALMGKISKETSPADFSQFGRVPGLAQGLSTLANFGNDYDADMAKLRKLQAQLAEENRKAEEERHSAEVDSAGAAGTQYLHDMALAYADRETRRVKLIEQIHQQANAAIASANLHNDKALAASLASSEQALIDEVNKKFAEQARRGPTAHPERNRQLAINELLAEVKAEGKLADERDRQRAQVQAFNDSLQAQLQLRAQAYALDVASVGMGSRELALQQKLLQAKQQYLSAQARLDREYADKSRGMTRETYDQESASLKRFFDAETAATKQHYQDTTAAMLDWRAGAIKALRDWADQGSDVAGQTAQLFTNAFGSMNDALVNFVTTGKLNFADFAKSVIADLARMELRILESQILQSILGYFTNVSGTGIANSYMQGGGSSYAAGGVNWDVGMLSVGSRAGGGPVAGGSLYEVSEGGKPEILNAGGRTYLLMGAQGGHVEPAQRGDMQPAVTGRAGARGGDTFEFSFVTHVNDGGVQSQQGSGTSRSEAAKQLNEQMRGAATDVLVRALQPGGILWKQRVGQAS